MIFFLISASLFKQHRDQSINRVFDIICSAPPFGEIVLLTESMDTYLPSLKKQSADIVTLDSALWTHPYTLEIAVTALRRQIENISDDKVILMNVTYSNIERIQTILTEISQIGFQQNAWHPALILVVDDMHLTHVRGLISETFFIKSSSILTQEILSDQRTMLFKIKLYRWFDFLWLKSIISLFRTLLRKLKFYAKYIIKKLR